VKLDAAANNSAAKGEAVVSANDSRIALWTIPTNEELVVARQTAEAIGRS
jgi:acetate kinase